MSPINKSEKRWSARDGFSLVEMLVSLAILTIISLVLFTMLDRVSSSYRYANSKVEEFSQARAAFESITDRLSQATLNPYWDYDSVTAPTKYIRQSELRFICGPASGPRPVIDPTYSPLEPYYTDAVFFQAPMGLVANTGKYSVLKNLLNTWGYFVEYSSNSTYLPTFIGAVNSTKRFRLFELTENSENLSIYQYTSGLDKNGSPVNLSYAPPSNNQCLTGMSLSSQYTGSASYNGREWYLNPLYTSGTTHTSTDKIHILADNVVALILLPKLSLTKDPTGSVLAPFYGYDSVGDLVQKNLTGSTAITSDLIQVNQLPPIVQVTMVAIDEASARRLDSNQASLTTLQTALNRSSTGLFWKSSNYQTDISSLEQTLVNLKLNYRIFTSDVYLKEAKWSRY